MRQTNLKQTYIPPEIIVEEFFDDETLLEASPLNAGGEHTEELDPEKGSQTDPGRGAKSTIWGPDFSSFDVDDEDY